MKKELVVKDNALINASYSLNLVEQRLILLAIVMLREHTHNMELDYLAFNKPIKVTADSYINTFGVSQSTAYETLKDACKTLFARQFSYQEPRERGRIANKTTRWVSDIAYIDNSATVEFTFAPAVLPLILHLEKHLTSYELKQVSCLTSGYAIRLYELLIAWRSVGKTPEIKIEEFRKKMGVLDSEYQRMGQFKEKVLHIAIAQINEHTDITVEYEQHKAGRSIVAFSFQFKQKKTKEIVDTGRDPNTVDMFYSMTDAQIHTFGNQLAKLQDLGHLAAVGESYDDLAVRIKDMLKDEEKQKQFHPYLKQLGFSPKGVKS